MAKNGEMILGNAEIRRKTGKPGVFKSMQRHWQLYLVAFFPMMYVFIFKYEPMYGAIIAFKDFHITQGVLGSPWVGFKHFKYFFDSPNFWPLFRNTLGISLYSLAVGFPAPIILALALNEIRHGAFKRTVQMVTYAPYFISTVIMVSIIMLFLDPRVGFINDIVKAFGHEPFDFMGTAAYFKTIYVLSDVWQGVGYGAIVYLAALAGINTDLYEAARVDGASRFQKILHVDLPGIMPVAVILLILSVGNIMNVGFEKVYLMQNPLNIGSSEIIATYVYKEGLVGANFSFSSAVGLFNSVINVILLLTVNQIARKVSENSLW